MRIGGNFFGFYTRTDGRTRANFLINPATGQPRWLARLWRKQQARREYFAIQRDMYGVWGRLEQETDPGRRAWILSGLAADAERVAEIYQVAFGPDPNPDEDGRDLAESWASEAVLLRWLYVTEVALTSDERPYPFGEACRANDIPECEWPEATAVLTRLCETSDPQQRAELVEELCDVVLPYVGGQAAEVLAAGVAPAYQRLARRIARIGG